MTVNETLLYAVWSKGHLADGYSPAEYREDGFGNLMRYQDYGIRSSVVGWEIDYILPKCRGGSDHLSNLRPLNRWADVGNVCSKTRER